MSLRKLTPIDNAVYAIKDTIKELKLERSSMDPVGNIRQGLEKIELGVNEIKARQIVGSSIRKLEAELSTLVKLLPPAKKDKSTAVLINAFTVEPFEKKPARRIDSGFRRNDEQTGGN